MRRDQDTALKQATYYSNRQHITQTGNILLCPARGACRSASYPSDGWLIYFLIRNSKIKDTPSSFLPPVGPSSAGLNGAARDGGGGTGRGGGSTCGPEVGGGLVGDMVGDMVVILWVVW